MNSIQEKSNKEIIELVSKIVEPKFTFHMDDFYGDRGGIPYPDIEELDVLHFKFDGRRERRFSLSKQEKEELIIKIKNELGINCLWSVEIITYPNIGLFIKIVLPKHTKRIIDLYDEYQDYRNANAEKINSTYCYLNQQIPEEFIGWVLFTQS